MLGRLLWVALTLLPASGCALVVTSFEHSEHCQVTGSSACGTCIRKVCQLPVDACCGDASCRGEDGHSAILDGLDACAAGDQSACALALATAATGPAAAAGTCVSTMCKEGCVGSAVVEVPWTCGSTPSKQQPCAKCVLESCASDIAECCASSPCKSDATVAQDIGSCIGGDKGRCTYRIATEGAVGLQGKIRGCIAKQCASQCLGRTHESCDYYEAGSYCSCSDSEKASGPACPGKQVTGDCVLGAKGCTCGNYACKSSSISYQGCSCQFTGLTADTTGCNAPTNGVCCLTFDGPGPTCECSNLNSFCYRGEYSVKSCDLEVLRPILENASAFVPTCSN